MLIKTFWLTLLKVLGIFILLQSIPVISSFISTLFYYQKGQSSLSAAGVFVASVLIMLIYLCIMWAFIFKTSWLIAQLNLDKGYSEERIDLNNTRPVVLNIAIMVTGGLLFVKSLPMLCQQLFVFYQSSAIFRENTSTASIILHLVKTILAYYLMTKSRVIADFIDKKSIKQVNE
jgi:hypothetical protein